jgi:hypothetical protein
VFERQKLVILIVEFQPILVLFDVALLNRKVSFPRRLNLEQKLKNVKLTKKEKGESIS